MKEGAARLMKWARQPTDFDWFAANNQSGQFERLTIGTRHRRQGLNAQT